MALEPVLRKTSVKIEVDKWDWSSSSKATRTYDITPLVLQYSWQKSIKTPTGGCSLVAFPQLGDKTLIELFDPMDVVRISEFGEVKFIGFIRKIGFTGEIKPDGKPLRKCVITSTAIGGILKESELGLNLFLLRKDPSFQNAAADLATKIADITKQPGQAIASILGTIIGYWLDFITTLSGSPTYKNWFNTYIDYSAGLTATAIPGYPREFMAFHGEEEQLNLWQILQKFNESPFFELWFDEGPREVSTEGVNVQLPSSKSYLISRITPFNGFVASPGQVQALFDGLKLKTIPQSHLVKYDLNKSMEDVFTSYVAMPAAWNMSERLLYASGEAVVDEEKLGKYLYRPMNVQLFYTRIGLAKSGAGVSAEGATDVQDTLKSTAQTLLNWYSHADVELSGAIAMMVPKKPENDIRLGDKIEIEGITGEFYVESVAHSWSYGGRVEANLNVTRGLDQESQIVLSNKIFKLPKQGALPK